MANRSEKSRSNVLSIQNFVVWIQATHNNIISDQRKKLSQFFFKYFFDVPHSATFIFIIFMCAYVIASIAYIHTYTVPGFEPPTSWLWAECLYH